MKSLTAINDLPTPMWIAFMLLSFMLFWPLGLVILVYLIWSGKMMCCMGRMASWKSEFERWRFPHHGSRSTGNIAFDEYRETTLKRLEEEQREFTQFLEQLRRAKDQEEFDKFMSEQPVQQSHK